MIRRLTIAMAVVLALCSAAEAQVSRPRATRTPQRDTKGFGMPELATPAPGCTPGSNYMFADTNGCIYACAGSSRVLVAAAAGGCAMPTGALTATPTVTATPTPTATVTATRTATPTPTLTVTPTPTP